MSWSDSYTHDQFVTMLSKSENLLRSEIKRGSRGMLMRDFPNPHQVAGPITEIMGKLDVAIRRELVEAGRNNGVERELLISLPVALDSVRAEIRECREKYPIDRKNSVLANDRTYITNAFLDDFENRVEHTPPLRSNSRFLGR